MTQDHNDIYTIVERLRMLEEGLNTNQKSVNQLSATFKPKTVAVLTAKQDPKNPMAGKMVGGCEESEELEEAVANEDVLEKVKNSFVDYLKSIEDKYKDSHLKDKKHEDTDIKEKNKQDRDLIAKEGIISADTIDDEEPWHGIKDPELLKDLIADAQAMDYDEFYDEYSSYFDDPEEFWSEYHEQEVDESELGSALSGEIPAEQPAGEPGVSMKEASPVKTITNESGLWEVHGDEHTGFEIRHGNRRLPTRFKNLDEAEMALEMFNARQRKRDEAADYIDEA